MTELEAIAQVDYGYFVLGKINEKLSIKKQPIEQAVDKACGYDETKELRELAITTIEGIIEGKKVLGFDYAKDVEYMGKLKRMEEEK